MDNNLMRSIRDVQQLQARFAPFNAAGALAIKYVIHAQSIEGLKRKFGDGLIDVREMQSGFWPVISAESRIPKVKRT